MLALKCVRIYYENEKMANTVSCLCTLVVWGGQFTRSGFDVIISISYKTSLCLVDHIQTTPNANRVEFKRENDFRIENSSIFICLTYFTDEIFYECIWIVENDKDVMYFKLVLRINEFAAKYV